MTKNVYEKAIEKWGLDSQLDMMIEECSELIKAIIKYKRGIGSMYDIMEEAADVSIVLEQVKTINSIAFEDWRKHKENRLQSLLGD